MDFEEWWDLVSRDIGEGNTLEAICEQTWNAARASRWESIETAPRDGTEILLGWPSGSMASGGLYESSFTSATHWMPLPEPLERGRS